MKVVVNGSSIEVAEETTVAALLLNTGLDAFRYSVKGEPRAPLCGMGICWECRVTINGVPQQRSCQMLVADGMRIETETDEML